MMKINLLQRTTATHNFYAKYAKNLDICKQFSKNLVNVHYRHVEKKDCLQAFPRIENAHSRGCSEGCCIWWIVILIFYR